jgi:hypothetical protein
MNWTGCVATTGRPSSPARSAVCWTMVFLLRLAVALHFQVEGAGETCASQALRALAGQVEIAVEQRFADIAEMTRRTARSGRRCRVRRTIRGGSRRGRGTF